MPIGHKSQNRSIQNSLQTAKNHEILASQLFKVQNGKKNKCYGCQARCASKKNI